MTKYKFESVFKGEQGNMVLTVREFDAEHIMEVMECFREFLLGCGFSPKLVDEYIEIE